MCRKTSVLITRQRLFKGERECPAFCLMRARGSAIKEFHDPNAWVTLVHGNGKTSRLIRDIERLKIGFCRML